jgi:hypothetical protein
VFRPRVSERELEVSHTEKEAGDQLVSSDSFARYDQGQRELDIKVERQCVNSCETTQ